MNSVKKIEKNLNYKKTIKNIFSNCILLINHIHKSILYYKIQKNTENANCEKKFNLADALIFFKVFSTKLMLTDWPM